MENGHLIVGKFSHTIEEIDTAVDKILQDGKIKEVKKPVMFGRCIPMNAQCGSRYYYNDSIKIKRGDVRDLHLAIDHAEWIPDSTYYAFKVDYPPVIVKIPKDFDYIRFVLDSEYRESLCEATDGNIENTAAPYWKIINDTPVFTKVASLHDRQHVKLFAFRRTYKRHSSHAPFSRFKAVKKIQRGCYCIAFATTNRRRRKVYITKGSDTIKKYLRKCSIISAKWYCKPTKKSLEDSYIQVQ